MSLTNCFDNLSIINNQLLNKLEDFLFLIKGIIFYF